MSLLMLDGLEANKVWTRMGCQEKEKQRVSWSDYKAFPRTNVLCVL